jgi:hypothetical protein
LLLSTTVNGGRKPAEIEFDYVDQSGDLRITLLTMRGNQKNADWALDERTITYAEFDKWDDQMDKLTGTLYQLAADSEPVNQGAPHFVQDVAKIIASSENVLPFSKRPFKPKV